MKTATSVRERNIVLQLLVLERAVAAGTAARKREVEAREKFRAAALQLRSLGVGESAVPADWEDRMLEATQCQSV
jgi:hypothetical protein